MRESQTTYRFGKLIPLLLMSGLVGCEPGTTTNEEGAGGGVPVVSVVNYPLKYFAERIGGKHIEVIFPAPAEGDPAYWSPSEKEIATFQTADLVLLNGAGYAQWVKTASLSPSKLVDTSAVMKEDYIVVADAVKHSHGPGEEHSHKGTAFTIWLDLDIAAAQAKAIYESLADLCPECKEEFEKNFDALVTDLRDLDAAFARAIGERAQQPVVFSHPVYQYLARKYELNGRSVHWEPEEPPSNEQWQELEKMLGEHSAKWMIWEGQPSEKSVQRLQKLGVESAVFDPAGNTPEEGDWLDVMKTNAEQLARAYAPEASE